MAPNRDLSSPLPWRRSLRASQARRAQGARRRRLALRGRLGMTLAVWLCAVAAGGAVAQDTAAPSRPATRSAVSVRALQGALGIRPDGRYGARTRAAVRRFQRAHGLAVDGIAGPRTLAALGLASQASASPASDGDAGQSTLQRIAQCESGGNPSAVSASGAYRGKYQFDRATWEAYGGSGDPVQATEAEQDQVAAKLLAARGTTPWPNCA